LKATASLAALPPTLTIPEAARLLGISRSATYRAAAKGEIPTIRIGCRLLVPTAKLVRLARLASRHPRHGLIRACRHPGQHGYRHVGHRTG
jgi:excisionase family DNA binding protein